MRGEIMEDVYTLHTMDGKVIKMPSKCPFCDCEEGEHTIDCFCIEMLKVNDGSGQPCED